MRRRDSNPLLAPDGKTDRAQNGNHNGKNSNGNGALTEERSSWVQSICIRLLTTVLGTKRSLRLAKWFFGGKTATPPQTSGSNGVKVPPSGTPTSAGAETEWTLESVTALVRENVQKFCGESCKDDTPLLEAGIESSSAVAVRERILAVLPDIKLPNTLIFDYPNIAAIGKFIYEQIDQTSVAQIPATVSMTSLASAVDEPIAIP